jgi:histidine triad (HIT) family protein
VKDCIFCQIAQKKSPARYVYEDKEIIVFHNARPMAPVHLLIIPKKHLKGIQFAEKKDIQILGKMLLVARKVAEKEKLRGYKLYFNCGKLGGQVISHLHLHLVGGWKTPKEFQQLAEKIIKEGGAL